MMAARDPSAASARTADVMRTDVRSELESGRCRHGDPNDGSGDQRQSQTAEPTQKGVAARVNSLTLSAVFHLPGTVFTFSVIATRCTRFACPRYNLPDPFDAEQHV